MRKNIGETWPALLLAGLIVGLVSIGVLKPGNTRGAAVMYITNLSSTTLQITLSNTAPTDYYEIQRRLSLNPLDPWTSLTNGTQGQTSFAIDKGIVYLEGFYQAVNCTDCAGDRIPNNQDGNPLDPNVLTLAVTIDDPANGSSIP